MAAPASMPEFKGNVAAVRTEQYWDMELVELRTREEKFKAKRDEINAAVKAKKMTRQEGEAALEKLYASEFNPKELKLLKESVSNAAFHYLGSARIMTQIGKGFAEAMGDLMGEGE